MDNGINRVDALNEVPFFFGEKNAKLFGVIHQPVSGVSPCNWGWVFCYPFGVERSFSQRVMVEWARVLAREGHWVLRFDYRGSGDSEGNFEDFTVEDYLDDISLAVLELEKHSGAPCRGYCGMRLGGGLAALAARRDGRNPSLILWEPIVRGEQYLDELVQAIKSQKMFQYGSSMRTQTNIKESLLSGRQEIVFGFNLSGEFCRSLSSLDLLKDGTLDAVPTYAVHITNRTKNQYPADLGNLIAKYAQTGSLEHTLVCTPIPWQSRKDCNDRPDVLFDPTLSWVRKQIQAKKADREGTSLIFLNEKAGNHKILSTVRTNPRMGEAFPDMDYISSPYSEEHPVGFSLNGEALWGILHTPRNYWSEKPVIVMVAPGNISRTATNGLFVRLARDLTRQGWVVLRFDPRGLGDSEGVLDFPSVIDLFRGIQDGFFVPDMLSSIQYVKKKLQTSKVLLVNLCGGALTAIHAGIHDPGILGISAIDFPFIYNTHPRAQTSISRIRETLRETIFSDNRSKILSVKARWLYLSLQRIYDRSKNLLTRLFTMNFVRKPNMPDTGWFIDKIGPAVNVGLIRSFMDCLEQGIPVQCIFASPDSFWQFNQIKEILYKSSAGGEQQLTSHFVEGCDHLFSQKHHYQTLLHLLDSWLNDPHQSWASAANFEEEPEAENLSKVKVS